MPTDWSTVDGSRVNLRVAMAPAARPEQRIGVLLFNPGGPGASAADLLTNPEYFAEYFPSELRDRFDIVGVDPRGVGGSQALTCSLPPDDPAVTRFPADARQAGQLMAANARLAKSCVDGSGPLVGHVDTESVARDLDHVRRLLGEERISFLGISYGTMVAQSYAELFPRRLRALALDGVVDRAHPWRQLLEDNTSAVEDGVGRFATWCAANETCALHGQDVRAVIRRVLAKADAHPVPAGDHAFDAEQITEALTGAIGGPGRFPFAAKGLREIDEGGDASALLPFSRYADSEGRALFRAISCQGVIAPANQGELVEASRRIRQLGPTLRGASESWDILSGCAGWPIPSPWRPHAWRVPQDFTRTLLVSGAHDVSTPRAWAESVHQQIPNSVLLRWEGDGHTAWLANHNPQARQATARYLIDPATPVSSMD
ncbi:alpha/beta hydrolase [Streptoalloteichus tenebrarius]|uniref:alpha/beta hydrolase n=1 Tax=Streptoalloteichus tenebrarius (strain ATCC 17920 / DSM 40477 / JCM 4838 / CBS 697.72 / NBRC 16177 / NCIMB 11028 / NRRL B-12390 / A12253. 1 / ISP 5477) TaxID=1933 RepID=UPI0020A23FC3|nr:alpha/beta hydrolase [Streptoalloteichus tenebrarius]BFF01859.1 alpha/beta hydrolase [Streptoalloteichus tenebrarius]